MPEIKPKIEESWRLALNDAFNAPYFSDLKKFLIEEKRHNTVFPPGHLIFNAFNQTPLSEVKVVILGQDPYHGPRQAHGLCFSVPEGINPPPSLINIFKEIKEDTGNPMPANGDLTRWAQQGVLLLNATLTVRARTPASHQGKGWEQFTDSVINTISQTKDHVAFLLWGRYAKNKAELIDSSKHLILQAAHPSPYSADKGFFGCRHFSKANEWLVDKGLDKINW
ncbi:uracil-DNA glycosylase [Marinilabilia rubra]|uniref:Uracil-DNA glycosylase n=1 Tax=Marinilabilia rubra TaxID=2162893 RepID=A0A2U2BEI5_9BACT|nr:uracil-DNA glycosylase [Marinilabilia rubra]PWE01471.1 uracil-DNA glycosylase [Marinilabilia rubra]